MSVRRIAVVACLAAGMPACFAPPALLPARHADLEAVIARYPAGTEPVSVEVERDVRLRGVFVPSDEGAPVVLHLLESSGSCASKRFHFGRATRQLSDLGFASLILDYTGVGASEGSASVDHLERDAWAMWSEAVRRAGSEDRVYVRATSLGAISTALLLQKGARPAGIVLIAPALADSAVERFAHAFHGRVAGWIAWALFRDIADVDLVAAIRNQKARTLVIAAKDDVLLREDERKALATACVVTGSRMFDRPGGHLQVCVEAHLLLREEAIMFAPCASKASVALRVERILAALPADIAGRFTPGTVERARLEAIAAVRRNDDPLAVAAVAISIPHTASAARLLGLVADDPYQDLDFDELCAVLSLDDPAGPLPIDLIESASLARQLCDQLGGGRRVPDADAIARATLEGGVNSGNIGWSTSAELAQGQAAQLQHESEEVWLELSERGLSAQDVARQFMRIELKANRIPDRLRVGASADPRVEVKEKDGWVLLDPANLPAKPGSFSFTVPQF